MALIALSLPHEKPATATRPVLGWRDLSSPRRGRAVILGLASARCAQLAAPPLRDNRELIVIGRQSPAFADTNLLLREMTRFTDDPSLALVFEKWPNRDNPLQLDPLIIVRRAFFLDVGSSLKVPTAGALAIERAMAARRQHKQVGHV
jgi:hypothetical protein